MLGVRPGSEGGFKDGGRCGFKEGHNDGPLLGFKVGIKDGLENSFQDGCRGDGIKDGTDDDVLLGASSLRLLTKTSSPMSVGQPKPRGQEQILGRKTAQCIESPVLVATALLRSAPAGKKRGLVASAKYELGVGEVAARERPLDAAKIGQ